MFGKKIPNPKIKEFEEIIERRGFILVNALFFHSTVYIPKLDDFLDFAQRSAVVDTIFTETGCDFKQYFYMVNGFMFRTSLLNKVKKQ